jgi:hypothetical protein
MGNEAQSPRREYAEAHTSEANTTTKNEIVETDPKEHQQKGRRVIKYTKQAVWESLPSSLLPSLPLGYAQKGVKSF